MCTLSNATLFCTLLPGVYARLSSVHFRWTLFPSSSDNPPCFSHRSLPLTSQSYSYSKTLRKLTPGQTAQAGRNKEGNTSIERLAEGTDQVGDNEAHKSKNK